MLNTFKRITATLFAVLVACATSVAVASGPSFDNLTATYQSSDFKSVDVNTNGFSVALSKTLGDVLFARASVSRDNASVANLDDYRVGLGVRLPFSNGATAYGVAYGIRAAVDYSNPNLTNLDSWGYGLEGGLRALVLPSLELRGGVATERLTRTSAWDNSALIGATLNLNDTWAVVADARINKDVNRYNVGLQLQF